MTLDKLLCSSLRSLKTGIFLTFQIMVLNTLSSNIPAQIASDCKIRLGYRICKQYCVLNVVVLFVLSTIILQFEQECSCPNCIRLQNQTRTLNLWTLIMCPKCVCLCCQNLFSSSLRSLKTGIFLTYQAMVLTHLSRNIPARIASDCKIRLSHLWTMCPKFVCFVWVSKHYSSVHCVS